MKEPLSAYLLKNNHVTPEKLTDAIKLSGENREPLTKTLVSSGAVEADKLITIMSDYYGVPFINSKQSVDSSLFQLLPESVIHKYKAIPVKLSAKTLTVALVEPDNEFSKEYIQMVSGYIIEAAGILESDFKRIVEIYFSSSNVEKIVKDLMIPNAEALIEQATTKGEDESTITKLVDTILMHAVRLNASDVHIEPQDKELLIRFRIDGVLKTIEILPTMLQAPIISRIKVMANMNITEKRFPQDGQARMKILDRNIDLRISSLPARYGEKIVLRVLDKTSFLLGVDQLGMNPLVQSRMEEIITQSTGIFLVTGPTGSGKTTTLYTCLNRIRSSMTNIITLEDPIEYELLAGKTREGGITQVQMNPKINFNFVDGLKACLRQDPDVLFVGEIRDRDSAEIAFTSALTGHFVMSSLHTIDAPSTVTRLLDMDIEPYLIATTLKGIISQRLVRVLCSYCKEPYTLPKRALDRLPIKINYKSEAVSFFRPKGCSWCGRSGYRGRKGIFELLEITEPLRELILKRASIAEITKCSLENNMVNLSQAGIEAVLQGVTSVAEVLRVAPSGLKG